MPRILILDDDRELLFMIGLILERAGYEHLIATEGTEAWTLLNTESIDLFILDPFVPDVDGWEFCRFMEMNETLCHIPIIIYTSRNITFDSAYQLPKMVAGYIIKPFAVPDFLRAVKNALEEHGKPLPTSTESEYNLGDFSPLRGSK